MTLLSDENTFTVSLMITRDDDLNNKVTLVVDWLLKIRGECNILFIKNIDLKKADNHLNDLLTKIHLNKAQTKAFSWIILRKKCLH